VLVVDDEPDARETLQQILEHCDAEVLTAGSAREAMAAVESWKPHVLLSDIGMPGEDGYSLIRRLRELPPERGGRTPAAALTAFARGEDRRRALRAGFQMHVAKPVEVQELAAVVASLARGPSSPPAPLLPIPPSGRGTPMPES
jgi:CheY-like chemotaxis protein